MSIMQQNRIPIELCVAFADAACLFLENEMLFPVEDTTEKSMTTDVFRSATVSKVTKTGEMNVNNTKSYRTCKLNDSFILYLLSGAKYIDRRNVLAVRI